MATEDAWEFGSPPGLVSKDRLYEIGAQNVNARSSVPLSSMLGLIIHRIWSMPCAEASIVTVVTIAPSREMSTDDCPLVWIHVSVTPVQKEFTSKSKRLLSAGTFPATQSVPVSPVIFHRVQTPGMPGYFPCCSAPSIDAARICRTLSRRSAPYSSCAAHPWQPAACIWPPAFDQCRPR